MVWGSYNHAPVDADYEVEPWLYTQLQIRVAQYLESVTLAFPLLGPRIAVEAREIAIEGVKHGVVCPPVGIIVCQRSMGTILTLD